MHAGLEPDPSYGGVVPAIHQASHVRAAGARRVRRGLRLLALAPTRRARRSSARWASSRAACASAFSSGMAAEHALITAVAAAGDHVVIPNDLYGGTYRLVDKVLTRWGLHYTMVDQTDLDARRGGGHRRHEADLGRDADQPDAERRRHRGDRRAQAQRARGRRQHVRHARLPAPAGARRRRRRALDHQVHRRALGRRRRRGDRARAGAARRRAASCRTRSAPCPGRSTASSCTAASARCTCGWRRTRENARAVSEWLRRRRRRPRRPLARLLRDGLLPAPRRDADRGRAARCSRSPSRSAAWSR